MVAGMQAAGCESWKDAKGVAGSVGRYTGGVPADLYLSIYVSRADWDFLAGGPDEAAAH
jgi:hypothetical protein